LFDSVAIAIAKRFANDVASRALLLLKYWGALFYLLIALILLFVDFLPAISYKNYDPTMGSLDGFGS